MKVSGNVTYYLEGKMQELHNKIKQKLEYIKSSERQVEEWHDSIAVLKVHYTSLLNTALAYEDFDKEEFESCLA